MCNVLKKIINDYDISCRRGFSDFILESLSLSHILELLEYRINILYYNSLGKLGFYQEDCVNKDDIKVII